MCSVRWRTEKKNHANEVGENTMHIYKTVIEFW